MSADEYFSGTYQSARAKFLAACRELRVQPTEFRTPDSPQAPEPPLVDCLRLGSPSARQLLVICGGDRKTDALCCSAIETGWLLEFGKAHLPEDAALLLLHHGAAPPTGGEIPSAGKKTPKWEDDILAKVEARYAEYARQHGIDSTGAPLAQPTDGDVPGYPGRLLDMLAHSVAPAGADRIVFLEIHVGTGPWGEAELTPRHAPGSTGARHLQKWFSMTEPGEDTPRSGHDLDCLGAGLRRRFADTEIIAATVAFGTYSMKSILDSLAARPESQAIPNATTLVYPEDAAWRDRVWHSAMVVIQRALTGLRAK